MILIRVQVSQHVGDECGGGIKPTDAFVKGNWRSRR